MNNPKQKVLFIDRDGVLLMEPSDEQVDDISKVRFAPGMFSALSKIARLLDYKLVMVTNQDGLGTPSFPEKDFWPIQELLIRSLESEGVCFDEIHIDSSFKRDNSPYRKPGTARLRKFMQGEYDLENSFVIGDRMSDMQLAKNLTCKGIRVHNFEESNNDYEEAESCIALHAKNWGEITSYLFDLDRISKMTRSTKETHITASINLDGNGEAQCNTGLAFFDHMLDQIARHGKLDIQVNVNGDLEVDEHHTIEDTAIVLGEILGNAVGSKVGMKRYGFALPMDDVRAQVLIDFGGRSWLEWDVEFKREKIGDVPTEMFFHFFKSLSDHAKINLNIKAYGDNEHHKIEAVFKAFGRSINMAVSKQKNDFNLPTTKGML